MSRGTRYSRHPCARPQSPDMVVGACGCGCGWRTQDACAAPKTEQRTGPRTRRRLRPVGSAHTTPAPRAKLAPVTPLTPLSALMSRLRGKSTRRPRLPRAHLGTQARLPAAQLGTGQVPETAPSGAPEEAAAQKLEEDDEYSVAQSMWQALGMAYITYAVITFPQVLLWALAVAVVDVCVCTVLEWCVLVASGPTVLRARFAVADALRDHCPGLWRAVCGRGAMPRTPPGGKSNRLREAKPPQAGFLQRQVRLDAGCSVQLALAPTLTRPVMPHSSLAGLGVWSQCC